MKKILATLALAACTLGYAMSASAATITFDSLASESDNFAVGSSYAEAGYLFEDITTASSFGFAAWGSANPFYSGSTALINNNDAGATRLTSLGGVFSLSSIDLSVLYPGLTGDGATTVTFTGYKSDNSNVVQSFSVNDGLAQTFFLSGFTGLTSVVWNNDAMYSQFDNLSVSSGDVAVVPLPGAILLFAPALGLIGLTSRRRRA